MWKKKHIEQKKNIFIHFLTKKNVGSDFLTYILWLSISMRNHTETYINNLFEEVKKI